MRHIMRLVIKLKLSFFTLLITLCYTNTSQAVEASRGAGDALIFPLYTVNNGNDTLVNIANLLGVAQAAKVTIREAMNGQPVASFNVYLGSGDTWSAAISADASGAKIITGDATCTVPVLSGQNIALSSASYQGNDYGNGQGGAQGDDRTRIGFIEVLSMGSLSDQPDTAPGPLATFTPATWADAPGASNCSKLVQAWEAGGVWENDPSVSVDRFTSNAGLGGDAIIINVPDATAFGYSATALAGWSNSTDRHSAAGSDLPNLGSGNHRATLPGYAFVEFANGWDAVSAVLQSERFSNSFITLSALGAATDWVVTFPTKHHYVNGYGAAQPAVNPGPFEAPWSSDFGGTACQPYGIFMRDSDGGLLNQIPPVQGAQLQNNLCWSVNIVSFNGSNLLGGDHTLHSINNGAGAGKTEIVFNRFNQTQYNVTHNGFSSYGVPMVGFAVQKFTNSQANAAGSTNNYAAAFSHKTRPPFKDDQRP